MLVTTLLALTFLISGRAFTEANDSFPRDDLMRSTSFPPTETNVSLVRFYLWTRENPDVEDFDELFVGDEESILSSHFDPQKKTKILAHGFTSDGKDDFVTYTTEAYLEKGEEHILPNLYLIKASFIQEDCNVISVDYEPLAPCCNYVMAARNAMPVGTRAAEFLQYLIDISGAMLDDFHGIGCSLGGQVMGGMGHAMNGEIKRITALDPAGTETTSFSSTQIAVSLFLLSGFKHRSNVPHKSDHRC